MTRYRGTIMQTPRRGELQVLSNAVIEVDGSGTVTSINTDDSGPVDHDFGTDSVVLPGLVDTHIHAPQWPQLGTGLDLPLESWLFEYTFPIEQQLTDAAFAATVWQAMVRTLLAHGTTTAVYYATVDVETTTMLAATCAQYGQRALVGRVAMDHPTGTPDWYRDASSSEALSRSTTSIAEIQALKSNLVHPILTPRFIPACTDETLTGLGQLAEETGVRIQTHVSESDWEHRYVLDRFGCTDTEALRRFGLVRSGSVLAHGDHLSDDDFSIISSAGAGVAHCPLSNSYFANAVFPARRALDAGVKVGLGTDIAGGAQPGLLGQAAHAVTVSRMLEDGVDPGQSAQDRGVPNSRLSIVDAFFLATVGGADLVDLPVGLIEVGRQFDALVINTTRPNAALQTWPVDDDARKFEKVVRLATPDDIDHVFVDGTRVSGAIPT